MKKRLHILLILLFTTVGSFATSITSTQDGEWSTGTTWIGGSAPTNEDTVIINHTVSITDQTINYNGVVIVNGILNLVRTCLLCPLTGLNMSDGNSKLIIKDGGQLTSGIGLSALTNFISIGTNPIAYTTLIDGATIDGPAGITEGDGLLPIELISFTATLSGEVVDIAWATASEINNEFFTPERSVDGANWEIIGEVAGAGNSSERLDYSYVDFNPVPGISYYRLKQTDYDGKFEYFAPAVVLYEPENLFKVFPNPTVGIIQLTTSSDLSHASIFLKDLKGQQKLSQVAQSQHQTTIDLSDLPKGVYILEIVFPESVLSRRIVKN